MPVTLRLGDIMTPDPLTAPPGTPLAEAAAVMRERGVGSVIVARRDRRRRHPDRARPREGGRRRCAPDRRDGRPLDDAVAGDDAAGRRHHARARPDDRAALPAHPDRRRRQARRRRLLPAAHRGGEDPQGRPVGARDGQGPREHHRRRDRDLLHRRPAGTPDLPRLQRRRPRAARSPSSTSGTCCTTASSRRTTRFAKKIAGAARVAARRRRHSATSPSRTARSWARCRRRSRRPSAVLGLQSWLERDPDEVQEEALRLGAIMPTLVVRSMASGAGTGRRRPRPDRSTKRRTTCG